MDHIWSQEDEALRPLMDAIHRVIDSNDATSLSLKEDLTVAQQGLAFAKEQYLRHLLLYNHLQEFMDDHRVQQHRHQQQLQQPTAHEPRITPPSKVADTATQLLLLEEALQYVESGLDRVNQLDQSDAAAASSQTPTTAAAAAAAAATSNDTSLLGLDRATITSANIGTASSSAIQQKIRVVQQHLVPELEQRLYQQQEEIRAFYQPDSVREGSEFYDEIAERRARISEEQESMRRAKEAVHNTLWTFYGIIGDILQTIGTLLEEFKLTKLKSQHEITTEWLVLRCNTVLLKLRVFKYQVMQKAYTKESVLALKKIKAALDTELQAAEASLQHSTTEIHAYERIGAQFNPIVDEYTHIQERIAHVQWALLQLKQQQHPDE